jgi:hypothetical protein
MSAINGETLRMSRILKGAGAVSALALVCAAHAIADTATYQLTLKGKVPGYCTVSPNVTVDSYNDFSRKTTSSGLTLTLTAFANTDGTGKEFSAHTILHVLANSQCNYVVKSKYGALKNTLYEGQFRPYVAGARNAEESWTPTQLDSLRDDVPVATFSIARPQAPALPPANTAVSVDVEIPPSGVLAAGDYEDILTLTVSPQ